MLKEHDNPKKQSKYNWFKTSLKNPRPFSWDFFFQFWDPFLLG